MQDATLISRDADDDQAARVGALLLDRGATVAVAESCTGGLLGHRLTSVSGSSGYFPGGILAYSNAVKQRELHVPAEMLDMHGAVSAPVAERMAHTVRERFDTTYGIGVSGIAGPGGGTEDKPVGLVYLALASASECRVARHLFDGDRRTIKELTTSAALEMLEAVVQQEVEKK